MKGWIYLIRNGDLHKIGITRNFQQRMKKLRPDDVVAKKKTNDFQKIEKQLHKRFKTKRIPQTEYFRLNHSELIECKKLLTSNFSVKHLLNPTFFIGYFLGVLLVSSALKPSLIDLLRSFLSGLPPIYLKLDPSYPFRFIGGYWLICLMFICQYGKNKK